MSNKTILYQSHAEYGADFTDFGGYKMPVRYEGSSINEEHMAVRESVGMFDVSHMGRYWVTGEDAKEFLDILVPRDVIALSPGRAGYTFMLNEMGGFKDDVIISQVDENEFFLVCNAGNREKIWNWMNSFLLMWRDADKDIELENKSDVSCMIAVQGPKSMDIIAELSDDQPPSKPFRLQWTKINGEDVLVSTTGYTGEAGVELIMVGKEGEIEDKATALWESLLEKGVTPCALGARDTLRLEAGYCLYGNDIDETTHLLETGLDFSPFAVIEKEQGYIGQQAVLDKQDKVDKVRVGFKLLSRGIPRHGYKVVVDGEEVGEVTSGTQSPLTKDPIGMAYVPKRLKEPGSQFQIDIRGRLKDAEVLKFPVYDTDKYGAKRQN